MEKAGSSLLHGRAVAYVPGAIAWARRLSRSLVLLEARLHGRLRVKPLPPQFVMLWVPGLEAIPLSIAYARGHSIGFIVKPVGETTGRLASLEPGSRIGLYGPLGRPLVPGGRRILFIAGGAGVAPVLHYAIAMGCSSERECLAVAGFWRRDSALAAAELLENAGCRVITACIEPGCRVYGTPVDALNTIGLDGFDTVVSAGPPAMLRRLARIIKPPSRHILVLDAMVKCGLGLCGSCIVPGTTRLLCIDGPGFYASEVAGWWRGG